MSTCKPRSKPLEAKIPVTELVSEGNPENSKFPCSNVIGSLMYSMLWTRPDLCYPISLLSRFQSKPSEKLWTLIKCVLRYVKGTLDYKLVYTKNESANFEIMTGYTDASHATNDEKVRSTSGTLIQLFDHNLVAWSSQRQRKVAYSTMTAEYYALCELTRDILWMRQFLKALGVKLTTPTLVYEDSTKCIAIANNPSDHKGTREINTKLFFVRDELNVTIRLEYIPSSENIADLLTKPLEAYRLRLLCEKVNLSPSC